MTRRSNWKSYNPYLIMSIIVLLLAGCGMGKDDGRMSSKADNELVWDKPPQMSIDVDKQYRAKVSTTKGDFSITLFADKAPITVNNFIFLASEGYYDGVIFHTVINDYMIQTGDRTGTGLGHTGYRIQDELDTGLQYEVGSVAMATDPNKPNSGSSQFFIGVGEGIKNLNLEPKYTIFGKIESGLSVVKDIALVKVKNNRPVEDIFINNIVIEEM